MPTRGRLATLAIAWALAPAAAHAQDATALVVLGGPPLLLAPILTAVVRAIWLRRAAGGVAGARFAALSFLELCAWLVAAWSAGLAYFQRDWLAGLVLVAALASILALGRLLCGRAGSWGRWLAFASVFPVTWFALQLATYGLVIGWETAVR